MKRNYGIDLLKIMSMLCVMILHIMWHGGIINSLAPFTPNYYYAWLLTIFSYSAVDCFVITTGYVSFGRKDSYTNLITLWIQVVFYSLFGLTVAFFCGESISKTALVKAFLPVLTNAYWFFTAYFGMYIAKPLLNTIIESSDKRKLFQSLGIITLLVCVLSIKNRNIFNLHSGYSVLWFLLLYLIGGTLRKYENEISINPKKLALCTVSLFVFTWLSKIGLEYLSLRFISDDALVKYNSPTILLAAISLVYIFSHIEIEGVSQKIITLIVPLVFSVYLIQDNKPIRHLFIENKYAYMATEFNPLKLCVMVLGYAVGWFLIGIAVDSIRKQLFRILHVRVIAEKLDGIIRRV